MRVEELLRPVLEDFVLFAKKVDERFLSYVEREELYRGIEEAEEMEAKEEEPLRKAYLKWIRKSFEFFENRDVELDKKGAFEENPWFDILHALGLQKVYVGEEEVEMGKRYGQIDEGLGEFVRGYVYKGYFWRLALNISNLKGFENAFIPREGAEQAFEFFSEVFVREDSHCLWQIPVALILRRYYEAFPEKRPAFSKILSDRLSQAIEEGLPEKHIRVIQTAIAVIKEDPESLPKGEPQSFAEKWLREELVEW
jgi:uncharacterized protein YnzC (UPF0291/DUF896 family)